MYELYYSAGSCSTAVHVILNELGQETKLHRVSTQDGSTKTPEYLKMNPRGQVPLLVVDGQPMREGGAIITYLCDTHKSALMPASGWGRAMALQWLMFANSSLHPAYGRTFWINKNLPEEQREGALKTARAQIQTMWDEIEAHLAASGKLYVCGDACTAADILVTVIANWSPQNYTFGAKTKAMLKAVSSRPAYQKALTAEQVEYKAAA